MKAEMKRERTSPASANGQSLSVFVHPSSFIPHPSVRRPAYTLLEVVLVMAILVVLAAVAIPSMEALYGDVRQSAAADMVRARWTDARARAMEEAQAYRFAIMPDQGRFRVAPDRDDYWSGSDAPQAPDDGSPIPLVLEDTLPDGITFSMGGSLGQMAGTGPGSGNAMPVQQSTSGQPDGSGWTRVCTFLPDGTSKEDVQIAFIYPGSLPLIMKLRGMTGAVTVRRADQGGP